MSERTWVFSLILAGLVAFLVAALLSGCAGFVENGQGVVTHAGVVVAEVDRKVAPLYADAAKDALEDSQTLEEYEAAMEPWNRIEEALRASYAALRTMQNALDLYVAGQEGRVLDAFSEGYLILLRLIEVLDTVGLDVAGELHKLVGELFGFLGQNTAEQ